MGGLKGGLETIEPGQAQGNLSNRPHLTVGCKVRLQPRRGGCFRDKSHHLALETGPATVGGFLRTSLHHKRTIESHIHRVEGRKLIEKVHWGFLRDRPNPTEGSEEQVPSTREPYTQTSLTRKALEAVPV